jgi:hypothetical protein
MPLAHGVITEIIIGAARRSLYVGGELLRKSSGAERHEMPFFFIFFKESV